jgi:ribosomal-protein-alanine N-acetyltransferase
MNVKIRPQRVSDAQRFFDILSNPHFTHFGANPKSVEEETEFLKLNTKKRRNKSAYNFSIMLDGKLVGGMGIMINSTHSYLADAGYFIDEKYWGRGIATKAMKLLEQFTMENTNVHRVEIRIAVDNIASQKVALNCRYQKEGILKQAVDIKGKWHDCYLYARIIR